ncbi:MAG: zinc-binding dehydrogenase [Acidimicrobiales bacterium]|nr:zinc-binding dehydrogenase [Acidimicrobiales bacterium]
MSIEGHAWTADRFGDPREVLTWSPRTWEQPAEGNIVVEVRAAGVGLPDSLMLEGVYPLVAHPPITPGQEVCGTVVAVGPHSRFSIGERVFGTTQFYAGSGGFASHAAMAESMAFPAPDQLTDEQAAGFYIGYRTAYTALVTRCGLQPGETVLVLGGAGSTGAASIALAKALDARVVAMASTAAKRAFCTALGADAVIDRDSDLLRSAAAEHTGAAGFNVVIDPVGGEIADAAMGVVARYGRFAAIGFASGSWPTPNVADMVMRNYSVMGVLAAGFTPEEDRAHMGHLLELAATDRIATPLADVAAMADVPAVVASLGGGAPPGKLVVRA